MLTTIANALGLLGFAAIRFGGRSSAGFFLTRIGFLVIALLVWALTKPENTGKSGT